MSSLLTSVVINNKNIIYKELKLKDYKIILKCLIGTGPVDALNLFLNLNQILKKLTNLDADEIVNLNFIEYLILLIHIRSTSIGSSIFGSYKNEDETENINVEISLYKSLQQLETCLNNFQPITFTSYDTTLTTTIPTINDILNNKLYPFLKENINTLPLKHLKNISKTSTNYYQYFKQYYFYKSVIEKFSIKVDLQLNNFLELIRIVFNENLLAVYDNLYHLCKLTQMTPEYLENCTYGEFKVFIKKTEEILYKNKAPDTSVQEPVYDPVDIGSLYGNDDIPITNSEFTP